MLEDMCGSDQLCGVKMLLLLIFLSPEEYSNTKILLSGNLYVDSYKTKMWSIVIVIGNFFIYFFQLLLLIC